MVAGASGDGFAAEFMAFLGMVNKLPRIEDIIAKPSEIEVPSEPALKYAISTALAMKATVSNIDNIMIYLERMSKEFQVLCIKDSLRRDGSLMNTKAMVTWSVNNFGILS